MDMLNQKQKIIAILVIAIVIIVIAYYYINSTKDVYKSPVSENMIEEMEGEETNEIGKKQTIKVHITGAVKTNGVVEIEKDGRINDAIEAAGGITEDADLSTINLAYKIEDGQKLEIPSIDDKEEDKKTQTQKQDQNVSVQRQEATFIIPNGSNTEDKTETISKININKATFIDLITLPGIGESTAVKILEYRKTNGNFQNIEQIKNVSGIGDAKYNVIKEFITV